MLDVLLLLLFAAGFVLVGLRDMHRALDGSTVVQVVREWVVRGMGVVLGPLLPADVSATMAP